MGMSERLKRARLEAGLSQRKLAQIIKGTEASIIRYESGQARPRPARLKAIAEVTNKPIAYFLEDDFTVPTTMERFKPMENKTHYRVDSQDISYAAENEPVYAALTTHLVKLEEAIQKLSGRIEGFLKDSKKVTAKK